MASEAITLESLKQLLHIQTELREQVETRWRKAQRALVGLLESFAPEEVDRRLKSGQPMDSLPVDELEGLLRQAIGASLHQAQTVLRQNHATRNTQNLSAEIQLLKEALETAKAENLRLTNQIAQLETEKSTLANKLAALEQVATTSVPQKGTQGEMGDHPFPRDAGGPPEPEWMLAWRGAETFDRDAGTLCMISESGLARRPLIEAKAAEMLGIKKPGGSIQALLTRLVGLGVIEISRPWSSEGAGTGGRYPDLVHLSERGQLAYWLLTGKQAGVNEYDLLLERHVTSEHTLLNLQAADVLREAGYQVNPMPPEIQLPNGGLFRPDIAITDEQGATHFVEVERDANKNIEQRQAKWRNFYQASGGNLYVICENRSGMRSIRSEINYCLGNRSFSVSLTNLADLQAGRRGDGDNVWLELKQKGVEN